MVMYTFTPLIANERSLQVPVEINGVADKDLPLFIYIFLYVDFNFNGFVCVFAFISIQLFLMICVIFLGNQFEIIVEIKQMLSYDGVRDRQRDKRIIRDCYMLHLEVME